MRAVVSLFNSTLKRMVKEMSALPYKVTLPGGRVVTMMANSAEQAARRAEREFGTGRVVTQRGYVSNRTKKVA